MPYISCVTYVTNAVHMSPMPHICHQCRTGHLHRHLQCCTICFVVLRCRLWFDLQPITKQAVHHCKQCITASSASLQVVHHCKRCIIASSATLQAVHQGKQCIRASSATKQVVTGAPHVINSQHHAKQKLLQHCYESVNRAVLQCRLLSKIAAVLHIMVQSKTNELNTLLVVQFYNAASGPAWEVGLRNAGECAM